MAVLVLALLFLGAECQDVPRVKTKIGIIEGTIKVSEPSSRKFSSFEGRLMDGPHSIGIFHSQYHVG